MRGFDRRSHGLRRFSMVTFSCSSVFPLTYVMAYARQHADRFSHPRNMDVRNIETVMLEEEVQAFVHDDFRS